MTYILLFHMQTFEHMNYTMHFIASLDQQYFNRQNIFSTIELLKELLLFPRILHHFLELSR